MKVRLAALLTFAIGFAFPTIAQQTDGPDPQLRQRLVAVVQKFEDAYNNNDAVALAALFSEEGRLRNPGGTG